MNHEPLKPEDFTYKGEVVYTEGPWKRQRPFNLGSFTFGLLLGMLFTLFLVGVLL